MKGDLIRFALQRACDPTTGVEITRLTDDSTDTDHLYFTAAQFDAAGTLVLAHRVFANVRQLCSVALDEGKIVQLTAEPVGVHGGCMDSANARAFFFSGRTLKSVALDTLAEEEWMSVPAGFEPGSLSGTADGRYVAFRAIESAGMELCTAAFESDFQGGSRGFREKFFRRPTSLIIRFDTHTRTPHVVTGETRRMTHTIIHPRDPDLVLFSHEGPWHLVQRLWLARVSTDEVRPLVPQQRLRERVGHEFFTAAGRIGAQYSYRHRPDTPFYLHADLYVNPDGSDERRYYYPHARPEHIHAHPTEPLAVGDTAQLRDEDSDHRDWIALVHYDEARHRAHVGRLCRHGTSWKKSAHPHPVFTPDGSRVLWGSDRGGRMNLYVARAASERCQWAEAP